MIALHVRLRVPESRWPELETTYLEVFLPALREQEGFRGSTLYRRYADEAAAAINAAKDAPEYVVDLRFDTEANRLRWVASTQHATAWPQLRGLASEVSHVGFDVVASTASEPVDGPAVAARSGQ